MRPMTARYLPRLLCIGLAGAGAALLCAGVRAPDEAGLFDQGRALFRRNFTVAEGFGYRLGRTERVLSDRQLGPDAKSCLECHNLVKDGGGASNRKNVWVGIDAGMERRPDRANLRNSTQLFGVGAVQALAQEMTTDLQRQRTQALVTTAASGAPVSVALHSKGVSFGSLAAYPNGRVDTSGVQGVDGGLVVKPFHAKGTRETLRRFTAEAAWRHHGLESPELLKRRYPLSGNWDSYDHDGDGVVNELDTEQVTALTVFQALLPMPRLSLPIDPAGRSAVERGQRFFNANCAMCHIPALSLDNPKVTIEGAMGRPPVVLDLSAARGTNPPVLLKPAASGQPISVPLYSDLKRHDLGPGLAEKNGQLSDDKVTGVPASWFVTTKLWGVADTPPYLHDGRADTLHEAVTAHGGEAQAAANAYLALPAAAREDLLTFLKSLRL